MKKGILLIGNGSSNWIGGLYYIKNIAFVLSQNVRILTDYNIYLLSTQKQKYVFKGLPDSIQVSVIPKAFENLPHIYKVIFAKIHNIKYIFPCAAHLNPIIGIQGISWIPDFQHNHLIQMYTKEERKTRIASSNRIINNGNPLVLSSRDCRNDLTEHYTADKSNVYVVPFVSFIENEIKGLTYEYERTVLGKYNLQNRKYVYIANQFWQHKNHIVVLEAVKQLMEQGWKTNYLFVFTGKMEDPRAPEYIAKLRAAFEDGKSCGLLLNLGFIERKEQIAVMKHAEFLIQPSLFEGWGTVVEDAKVLDKTVLLSDIPVHREQRNKRCILFDPCDPEALAGLIRTETEKEHIDNAAAGIADMYRRAREYSEGFERLLIDRKKKK